MNFIALCPGVVTSRPDGLVECSVDWVFVDYSTLSNPLFPQITMTQAFAIMTAVTLLFVVAWGFKQVARFILNR